MKTITTQYVPNFFSRMALWGITSLVLFLSSCSKDSDPAPLDISATLSAHTWTIKSLTAVADGKNYSSASELTNSEITFKADGKYQEYDPSDKTTLTGTWKLNGQTLTVSDDNSSFFGDVSDLTTSGFLLSLPQVDVSKLDLDKDISTLTPADKDYISFYQVYLLYFGNFTGFDTKTTPAKVQIKFNFVVK